MQFSTIVLLAVAAVTTQAANNVPETVVFSAPGAKDVVGNGFGCVNSKNLSFSYHIVLDLTRIPQQLRHKGQATTTAV